MILLRLANHGSNGYVLINNSIILKTEMLKFPYEQFFKR